MRGCCCNHRKNTCRSGGHVGWAWRVQFSRATCTCWIHSCFRSNGRATWLFLTPALNRPRSPGGGWCEPVTNSWRIWSSAFRTACWSKWVRCSHWSHATLNSLSISAVAHCLLVCGDFVYRILIDLELCSTASITGLQVENPTQFDLELWPPLRVPPSSSEIPVIHHISFLRFHTCSWCNITLIMAWSIWRRPISNSSLAKDLTHSSMAPSCWHRHTCVAVSTLVHTCAIQ